MNTISTSTTGDVAGSTVRTGASASANASPAASTTTSATTTSTHGPAVVVDLSGTAKAAAQGAASAAVTSLDLPKSFDELVQQRTDALAQKLTRMFDDAGIDVGDKIALRIDSSGMIRTDGPQKERIEQFFRDNPDIAKEFRDVASLNTMKATLEALRLYNEEMKSAQSKEAQAAVRDRFTTRSIRIQELSGSLTLENGTLTSAAVEYADSLSPADDKARSQNQTDVLT